MDHDPITDEQLGNAIRRISARCGQRWAEDRFQYYARQMVSYADGMDGLPQDTLHVEAIALRITPPYRIDGLAEHMLEMITMVPCSVDHP